MGGARGLLYPIFFCTAILVWSFPLQSAPHPTYMHSWESDYTVPLSLWHCVMIVHGSAVTEDNDNYVKAAEEHAHCHCHTVTEDNQQQWYLKSAGRLRREPAGRAAVRTPSSEPCLTCIGPLPYPTPTQQGWALSIEELLPIFSRQVCPGRVAPFLSLLPSLPSACRTATSSHLRRHTGAR